MREQMIDHLQPERIAPADIVRNRQIGARAFDKCERVVERIGLGIRGDEREGEGREKPAMTSFHEGRLPGSGVFVIGILRGDELISIAKKYEENRTTETRGHGERFGFLCGSVPPWLLRPQTKLRRVPECLPRVVN